MKKLLLLTTIILTAFTLSAQWELQYPIPTDKSLADVCFMDDMDGWAVGENGTIFHTNDGGISWDFQESGTSFRLRSVVFKDLQTGWIVGGETHPIPGDYIILHTTDGGNNWIEQDSGSTTCLRDVFFLDAENGWAVGDHNFILNTNDGGNNWTLQQSGTGFSHMDEVLFTDLMNGWIASSSGLWRTTDGGLDWYIHIPGDFESVFFLDQNEAWASSYVWGYMSKSGILLHTNDAFNTWDTLYNYKKDEFYSDGYYSIYFKDSNNGWMLYYSCYSGGWGGGCSYDLITTADGGNSWNDIDLPTSLGLNSLYFTQEGKGCIVGSHGIVLNTKDWNDEWVQTSEGNGGVFFSIDFPDNTNGWAVGGKVFNPWTWGGYGSEIVHTSDKGLTWEEQNSNISGPLRSVNFIDSNTGWAVGNTNPSDTAFIIHTTNGGEEWFTQKSDTDYYLTSVYFANDSYGWAVGGYYYGNSTGRILKTSDGGTNWEEQYCDTCKTLNAVYFADSENGWTVGNLGTIYNTTDGGQTWTQQFYDTTGYSFESVYFIDTQEGWMVGNKYAAGGILLHTTDAGNSWSSEMFVSNANLYSVHFTDKDNGLISGSGGTILLTMDGGTIWEMQDSGTDNILFSVFYTSDGQGYAAGSWGTIVHSSTLITSAWENPIDKNLAIELQCFPNPFSETTTLSYFLQQKSLVMLEVYNSTGQLVFKQKDKVNPEGRREIIFDSKDLPAGIYFSLLKTTEGIKTMKMIKL